MEDQLLAHCTSNHLIRSAFLKDNDPGCIFITLIDPSYCECHSSCHNMCGNNLLLDVGIPHSEIVLTKSGTAFYFVNIRLYDDNYEHIIRQLLQRGIKINKFPSNRQNAMMAFFPHYGKDYWGRSAMILYAAGALIETNRSYIDCMLPRRTLSWGPNNLKFFAVGVELDYYSVMCDDDICVNKTADDSESAITPYSEMCARDVVVCYCSFLRLYLDMEPDTDLDSSTDTDSDYDIGANDDGDTNNPENHAPGQLRNINPIAQSGNGHVSDIHWQKTGKQ